MIELQGHVLRFSFPEVHPDARFTLHFERTLRIPDDDHDYPLPPGLGRFPVRHVDDFADRVPEDWVRHGGVMLPMYQSEAMWIDFDGCYVPVRRASYPFAVMIAAGKINAVSGEEWSDSLSESPQNYCPIPEQPWLDGYCIKKGVIRQFVAMPLGEGYTAEEQITGKAEFGGIQILAFPMKSDVFEAKFPKIEPVRSPRGSREWDENFMGELDGPLYCLKAAPLRELHCKMGLAPGGRMRQEIYEDTFSLSDYDLTNSSRCFVHIANSQMWRQIVGEAPPTLPPTAKSYSQAGLPWFDYYLDNGTPLKGAKILKKLKSVMTMAEAKGTTPLPENESVEGMTVVPLRKGLTENQVREGTF